MIAMDIAMGGCPAIPFCTCCPLPTKVGVDFKMADIDRLSRVVPCICQAAPNNHDCYMEDVHRFNKRRLFRHPERIG